MTINITRGLLGLLAAGLLGAGVSSASPAQADQFCGARQDPLDCVPQTGAPSAQEATYINTVRGNYPGDDAQLLKMGRGTCNMLLGGVITGYVVQDLASHEGITKQAADQLMDAAMLYVCPGLTVGADGVARPTR